MFAAIDIGSNTVQMLICRAENGLLCDRRNYIATTRLGGGEEDGRLSRDAIERTAATVARFMEDVDDAKARCRIVATSAVRDAANTAVKTATKVQDKRIFAFFHHSIEPQIENTCTHSHIVSKVL